MKKDIPDLKVTDIAIAVVPRPTNGSVIKEDLWDTYLINLKDTPLKSVLISSKGYGEIDGEKMKTTTLRHFFEEIAPRAAVKVEPIQKNLFKLTNEYWISFVLNDYMFDKKYIFVQGSISQSHFTTIPLLEQKGVMIK